MGFLSDTLSRVKPSATIAMTNRAKELQNAGVDVIGLAAGEPDFPTPVWVKQAAIEAIGNNQTGYTAVDGTPALKNAIVEKFKRDNNLEYKPSQVCVNVGGKQSLYNALMATLNVGDEVIIPAPYWVSYPDMTLLAGGTPVVLQTLEADNFCLTAQALAAAITPKTKWLILNSPSNPTGACYTDAQLLALVQVLEKNPHVHILCDDIYEHILYDDIKFSTLATLAPQLRPRILIVNGASKAYAMTGWRIGFAAGDEQLIKAMAVIQSQSTSNPCSIAQAAALAALSGDQSFLKDRAHSFQERRDYVVDALNSMEGIRCRTPQGAFYVYPCCQGLIGKTTANGDVLTTDTQVALWLLDEAKVAVVQGEAFGLSPYFRISYATSMETLQKAMERMKAAIATLR